MNEIVPWAQLCDVIEPYYPKGKGGRPPIGLERMLRMYFVQHWFNLADEACEEALLDSRVCVDSSASIRAASACPMARRC
jgi:IS5 family transposase